MTTQAFLKGETMINDRFAVDSRGQRDLSESAMIGSQLGSCVGAWLGYHIRAVFIIIVLYFVLKAWFRL